MSAAKAYGSLIVIGRFIVNHPNYVRQHPEAVISAAHHFENELQFTPIDDFFSLFPPIKRYCDDGRWDFGSTNEMRAELFGTHFGKGDLMQLLMSSCYENKFVQGFGFALMVAIRLEHERLTGRDLVEEAISKSKEGLNR